MRHPDAGPAGGGRLTCDVLERFRLALWQRRDGLRFGLDAVLLAASVELGAGETALELGAGCGVVSLILARRFPSAATLLAVELDGDLAALARRNADENREPRVRVIQADYTRLALRLRTDVVFGNPPYRPVAGSMAPRDPRRALATREERATLGSTVAAAAGLVGSSGRVVLIYPHARRAELLAGLEGEGLGPTRVVTVRGVAGQPPRYVLVAAEAGYAGAAREEELCVLAEDGTYTEAAAQVYGYPGIAAMTRGGRRRHAGASC